MSTISAPRRVPKGRRIRKLPPTKVRNARTVRPRATSTSSREPLTNSSNATTLHKTFVRRVILFWKRIKEPKRPRHSRRFSFIPPGFVTVDPAQFTKSARRRAIYVNF
ncbi:uncharacterized protein LACBIDRAFT_305516 [Laccaria bicolor S238N-H82]|uniref:Predicted protein n=1 Tax=Laccaria bicolor (strain S238N-H82 / ATCC MYA-4686) TaxID=486041 RepID=B0CUF6_LACBS|nr:uncharacterized protein LACBIDRAFT_305516 [Laccaria bicolor S238N-H82]EDR14664.1 predicted protein [Laccaria bicolor S238N-H82]|eukprot:XP_001875223.1 predicted protein [Laccaria bicolor S238N-H82]